MFEQLNIDLGNLSTTTIKKPKIQETSTVQLLNCLINRDTTSYACNENFIKERATNQFNSRVEETRVDGIKQDLSQLTSYNSDSRLDVVATLHIHEKKQPLDQSS